MKTLFDDVIQRERDWLKDHPPELPEWKIWATTGITVCVLILLAEAILFL